MENLEEVLQALDDFQKMRPTEIPRELEDYLCWVAKTGDPVYQWSLIKTLFREKLTRVMTDFYETCPTLELAPCPNVEHFNYDTMKTNLLERLESFANAPFTVQRICELLTTPRKEYNRVDKFMRAIEKNILVVSTREPGPIARRSENGDGMVNGSVDDEAPATQPSQDVEMEYWEKDCASTVTISVHTVENETPMLQTVIPTTTVVKNVFGTEEVPPEKLNSNTSKSENSDSSTFVPATSEFNPVTTVPSQTQNQEADVPPAVQNLPTVVPEESTPANDAPEAVMNEDTSSQPSLDMENEEDNESSKTPREEEKPSQKSEVEAAALSSVLEAGNPEKSEEPVVQASPKADVAVECNKPSDPPVENMIQPTEEKPEENTKPNTAVEVTQSVIESTNSHPEKLEHEIFKDSDPEISPLANGDTVHRIPRSSTPDPVISEDQPVEAENQEHPCSDTELQEPSKTKAEEPIPKDPVPEDSVTINHEAKDTSTPQAPMDEIQAESTVPDTAPVFDEPKESESPKDQTVVMDIPKEEPSVTDNPTTQQEDEEASIAVENTEKSEPEADNSTSVDLKSKENDSVIMETNDCKKREEQSEMMEVDEEDSSMFRQDEPMEQETVELSKS